MFGTIGSLGSDQSDVTVACGLHKSSRCGRCDGSGYIVFTRKEWDEKQAKRRAALKHKMGAVTGGQRYVGEQDS